MGKIFYIIGKSSSGKDTIYKKILENNQFNLKQIVMYTTRPIRAKETEGVEYHFINDQEFEKLRSQDKIIEERSYNTIHGLWRYFTVNDGQMNTEEDCLMIGVLNSFVSTREYYGREKVLPIFIDLDDGVRLQRALDRERIQDEPKYAELCRRYLADLEDFAENKIVEAGITKRFYNEDLEKCLEEIGNYIKSMI
ncbi:MAG: guanylate kinase [Lachnospiraceae bacterium]|nr:guanylate kinase [Lachnospiraceae bacterium]